MRFIRGGVGMALAWSLVGSVPAPSPASPGPSGDIHAGAARELFLQVFPEAARLDSTLHRKVREGVDHERRYVDSDGDGIPEEVWFIDGDPRHPPSLQPLLVRAIDEDGDLRFGDEPDLDGDLYVADWRADGTVDAVLDYADTDGDGDLDEMALFFYGGALSRLGAPALRAWWSRDLGDDNLLWHDVGYAYEQATCQERTHFGGDEMFVSFALPLGGSEWVPFFEDPFVFRDPDGDGVAEEAVRVSGLGNLIESVRHSFDADDDATIDSPRDYDVSISAWAPGACCPPGVAGARRSRLRIGGPATQRVTLRGIPSQRFLLPDSAAALLARTLWERILLCWDEDDHNVAFGDSAGGPERWEGVIASGVADFPPVGGPGCGPFNKRYEIVIKPRGRVGVYYHPTDGRIHLRDADRAWMLVDYDRDGRVDLSYEMRDEDGDGILDRWTVDLDADGRPDESWSAEGASAIPLAWDWKTVSDRYRAVLGPAARGAYRLSRTLLAAVRKVDPAGRLHPIASFVEGGFEGPHVGPELASKLRQSPESRRFYDELLRDEMTHHLRGVVGDDRFWTAYDEARGRGDVEACVVLVEQRFGVRAPPEPDWSEPAVPRVDARADSKSRLIAWESDRIAYYMREGAIGFLGKTRRGLALGGALRDGESLNVAEWAVDALDTRGSAGCGGATLYINDRAYPVRDLFDRPEAEAGSAVPKAEIRAAVLAEDSTGIPVEMVAGPIGPATAPYTVRFRCKALRGRTASSIEVRIDGGKKGDRLELGIGMTQLPQAAVDLDPEAGVLGTWGIQSPRVGWIGMGLVYPRQSYLRFERLPEENQVVLGIDRGIPLTYYVECDWLRGRRFDRSPSASDWFARLRRTRAEVNPE